MMDRVASYRLRRWVGALRTSMTVVLGMAALVAVAAAPSFAAAPAEATVPVSIVDFAFVPDTVIVAVGDTVTWSNDGLAPHTTTADDATWDSGTMMSGAVFSFTFDTPGDFRYSCAFHPTMTGAVSVVAPAAAR
jgi:plastocyanin